MLQKKSGRSAVDRVFFFKWSAGDAVPSRLVTHTCPQFSRLLVVFLYVCCETFLFFYMAVPSVNYKQKKISFVIR